MNNAVKNISINIKIDEKPYKNILIYYIAYMTIKDSKYVKTNIVNPLYLMLNNMSGYFKKIKNTKKYEKFWIKTRDLIRSVTKKSDDYHEKCVKIKLDSNETLPLIKAIEIPVIVIVVRAIFYEDDKYFPQVFLDECLDKI